MNYSCSALYRAANDTQCRFPRTNLMRNQDLMEVCVNSTISTALIGMMIFVGVTLVCWIVLTLFHRGNIVLVRFFDDTAAGRELMRQAGTPPRLAEEDEPVLQDLLIKVASMTRWARYLFIGISVMEVVIAVSIGLSPGFDTSRMRVTILVATVVKFGLTMTVIGAHFWSRSKAFSASMQEQEQERG